MKVHNIPDLFYFMRLCGSDFMADVTLTIIIVNYNSTGFLENCLKSIFFNQHGISLKVIVVDNHPAEGAKGKIETRFPHVMLIENDRNLGFAKACNQGLMVAQSKYILFLNPDTIIKNDVFARCIEFIRSNSDTGLLGCKLVNANGSLQPSCADFPYIHKLILDHTIRWKIFPDAIREKLLLRYWTHDRIREVDWVLGAFMLARLDLLKQMGGFDEDFFLYGEDLELCYRIQQAGWKVVFFPYSEVIHFGNQIWDTQRLIRVYDAILKFYSKHLSSHKLLLLNFFIKTRLYLLRR